MSSEGRDAVLRRGLQALCLEETSLRQRQQLLAYLDLLVKWNQHYNLTAIRHPDDMLVQHLLDCLAVLRPLDARLTAIVAPQILDVGSGAGLPGVVLAIMRPRWAVCCVDAVAKKAAFIAQVAGELGLENLRSEHSRIEELQHSPFDVIGSRAFASLTDFVSVTCGKLKLGGCWLAMKGLQPDSEIAALPECVEVFHVEPLTVPGLDAQRCLVWIRIRSSGPSDSQSAGIVHPRLDDLGD